MGTHGLARLGAAVVAVGVLALAGCSGDTSSGDSSAGPSIEQVTRASQAAGPAIETGSQTGSARGVVSGAFAKGGDPSELRFPVSVGDRTVRPTVRRVGEAVYVRRAVATGGPATTALYRYGGKGPAWIRLPAAGADRYVGPIDALRALRALGKVRLVRVGRGEVGGDAVTRYRVRPRTAKASVAVPGISPFAVPAGAELELALDGRQRLRRWAMTSRTTTVRVTIDFRAVPGIAAPGPSAIVSPATTPTTLPGPTGPWTTIARGEANGVGWVMDEAGGASGTVCYRLVTTPSVAETNLTVDGASCSLPPAEDQTTPDLYFEIAFQSAPGAVEAVAATIPAGSAQSAEVVFAGGGTAPATLDPSGAVVYVGPPDRPVAMITLRAGADTYDCGPGDIAEVQDAVEAPPQSIRDVRTQWPWACVTRFEE